MNQVTRSDQEISKLKEQIIENFKSTKQEDLNLRSYLEGQLVMLVWFTSDLWLSQCYEEVDKMLREGKNKDAG